MKLSVREWTLVAMLLSGALLVGALIGEIMLTLLVAAVVWIALQYRELRALERWSRTPLARPAQRLDSWDALADRLYRMHRRSRARTRRTLQMFANLRVITEALPDAAVILDPAGTIESFNAAAEDMLNLTRSDRGGNLAALLRQPEFAALVRGRAAEGVVEFASPFNEERRLEARRIPIDGGHALILVRDVTQLNRLLTMRQDFVANVSHELRTPLTVVVGYLETMASEDLDPATTRELLGKLESPTLRMRALVDDLLLLSRLEANPPPGSEDLAPVDMSAIIRACVAEAKVLSEGRHRFEMQADRTLQLLGIETELHSAVLNIIANAVRYSPDGGRICVAWQRIDQGARFSVTDEGIGIAPEHIERITERFFRVDLARARVRGGTGLGLAIVKHVLKRHRSQLRVDSTLGRGSTFYCDFPEALLQPAAQARPNNRKETKEVP
jgi:two-component system, OmpR family, phosphate regulon sensor histidine kinase PhoR